MIKIKGLLSTFMAILMTLVSYGQNLVSPKEIDVIYVSHTVFTSAYQEYKIDLKNRKLWEYSSDWREEYTPRDESAENEGFNFAHVLEDGKIEIFQRKAKWYGFASWRDLYQQLSFFFVTLDGEQWDITIVFSDGTERKMVGYNAWPLTWNQMNAAFEELTGERILLLKSDYY